VRVREVGPEAAADVHAVVLAGFGARPPLDPPSTALDETLESVHEALASHGGVLATDGGVAVGALLFEPHDGLLGLRRVSVHPEAQGEGVAGALVGTAERVAMSRAYDGLRLSARAELPATVAFWEHLGYGELRREGTYITMAKALPVHATAPDAETTRMLGERLAALLRPGDLVILSGDLGAGKTTFTQGLGAGLGVRGPVTSPTFVISRVQPSMVGGPPLVHVDAYRLPGTAELDDLDLDTSLEDAVTVVEWGTDVAEGLADTRLELTITRTVGVEEPENRDDEVRHLRFTPVGARWAASGLRAAVASVETVRLA
jgi:tRNA threonylcarbamoyladenosine biosynthesis protein TsaE